VAFGVTDNSKLKKEQRDKKRKKIYYKSLMREKKQGNKNDLSPQNKTEMQHIYIYNKIPRPRSLIAKGRRNIVQSFISLNQTCTISANAFPGRSNHHTSIM
jgi:hypothetical protein